MSIFKDEETSDLYNELLHCYRSLIVKFELLEEYAMQYALLFQQYFLSKRFRKFEFSNIGEIHKFYVEYVYKNSVKKLDNYQIKTLEYIFQELIKDRNYYIHEYFWDLYDNCTFYDENEEMHFVKECLDYNYQDLRNKIIRYDKYINKFKTILRLDNLKNCRKYNISLSTKSIDINSCDNFLNSHELFFYTLRAYVYIESDLYKLFKYIQKEQKCFDDDFMEDLLHFSLGQYGKILKEKMNDNKVYLAIHDYIKNFDDFFKKINEINIDRNYLLHGMFPKYFVNNDAKKVLICDHDDEKNCLKTLKAAEQLDTELEKILKQYNIRFKRYK